MADTAILSEDLSLKIPNSVINAQNWKPGTEFALVPKGKGILLMPVPSLAELVGSLRGADLAGYRDRKDRY